PTDNVPISGRFAPGRPYRVSLQGVRDVHGQALARPFEQSVAFDDLWPTAAIGLHGHLIEPSARRAIPGASVNVKDIEIGTAPLDEAAIFALRGDERHAGRAPRVEDLRRLPGAKVRKLHPSAAANKPWQEVIQPEEVLGGKDKRG